MAITVRLCPPEKFAKNERRPGKLRFLALFGLRNTKLFTSVWPAPFPSQAVDKAGLACKNPANWWGTEGFCDPHNSGLAADVDVVVDTAPLGAGR
jgi:hypothetical protein